MNRKKGNLNILKEFVVGDDKESVFRFLRINENTFNKLLIKIQDRMLKEHHIRGSITLKEKVIVTLRYLATGESFRSLMYNYRISVSSISQFVPAVFQAIHEELKGDYLKVCIENNIILFMKQLLFADSSYCRRMGLSVHY